MVEEGVQEYVVIDCGSNKIKAGFASGTTALKDEPHKITPSVMQIPDSMFGNYNRKTLYGYDAVTRRPGYQTIQYPIADGVVQDFYGMEKLWRNLFFNELRCDVADMKGVFLADQRKSKKDSREVATEIMFE
mmetsp:Transcript_40728/g.53430  ORF Transcript_40728/g.53430 Transcript_40728/m.53430 type:complete len:132 (+) Transcript_40728:22-417(+)